MEQPRLKRAVIKEELVALTGNYVDAILLNQFIYWSERVQDFDQFIREEMVRAQQNDTELNMELTNGWLYKKSEELADETMLGLSKSNMLAHIKALVENGWVDQRRNPKNKMDKTYQYRVNISKIQRDLITLGYSLEGYRIPAELLIQPRSSVLELRSSKTELRSHESELRSSDTEQQYQRLHTEITSEITYNNKDAVAAVRKEIESHLGKSISSLSKLLPGWITEYGQDKLLQLARYIGSTSDKWDNIVGTYRVAVTKSWDIGLTDTQPEKDDRYGAFYRLYPDA